MKKFYTIYNSNQKVVAFTTSRIQFFSFFVKKTLKKLPLEQKFFYIQRFFKKDFMAINKILINRFFITVYELDEYDSEIKFVERTGKE